MENIYEEPYPTLAQPNQQLLENLKKDAKGLFLIQLTLDDEIFPRITIVTTSH